MRDRCTRETNPFVVARPARARSQGWTITVVDVSWLRARSPRSRRGAQDFSPASHVHRVGDPRLPSFRFSTRTSTYITHIYTRTHIYLYNINTHRIYLYLVPPYICLPNHYAHSSRDHVLRNDCIINVCVCVCVDKACIVIRADQNHIYILQSAYSD